MFGPLLLAVALLLSLAACSISGWGIKGILTQFWETLLGDPNPSTYNVDLHTAMSSPVLRKNNFPARCTGGCVPFPFPQ